MYINGEILKGSYGVISCTIAETKTNKKYIHGEIIDENGKRLQYKMWECSEDISGKVVQLVGDIQEYNGNKQVILRRYIIQHDANIALYRPKSKRNPLVCYDSILKTCKIFCDSNMYEFINYIFSQYKSELLIAPGAKGIHHACEGGLLEHLLETQELALAMSRAGIHDASIISASAALHDIGKLLTYKWNGISVELTTKGKLLGHIPLGIEIINKCLDVQSDLNISNNQLMHIKHIILSHHGKFEWGSPVLPASPEAYIIHNADNVGAKLNIFESERPAEGGFTGNKNYFFGTELYYEPKA